MSQRTVVFSSTAIISGCIKHSNTHKNFDKLFKLNKQSASAGKLKSVYEQEKAYSSSVHTLRRFFRAKERRPFPAQASMGTMTLSTSFDKMQALSITFESVTRYCGALLSPASTHGKNVYPIW